MTTSIYVTCAAINGRFASDWNALAEHAFKEDHRIDWSSAEIVCREANYKKRLFLEAWHSKQLPCINRCELYVPCLYEDI